MKRLRFTAIVSVLLVAAAMLIGCGRGEGDGREHGLDDGHGGDSHSGASFKAGKGVMLTDETRKILDVRVADMAERQVRNQIHFTAQFFGEKHRHLSGEDGHSGCDAHGSGFLAVNVAAAVKVGQSVELLKDSNSPLQGIVLGVQKALTLGESEIVVGISNAAAAIRPGEFLPARISLPRDEAVSAIPLTALLRTSEGVFVYAVNGDAYHRTAVKTGAESDGWVEITDGLLPGDQVVTNAAQTLWLIELRAVKGGGHCH